MFQDRIGIIQYVTSTIGIISEPILSDRTLLLIAAILVDVWKTTPFMALLLLAGLQVIPGDVYEAARVDGANVYQRFFQITLPLLKALSWSPSSSVPSTPTGSTTCSGDGPARAQSLSTFVYEGVRISQLQFGPGNAAAVFIFVTAFLLALFFIKVLGMRTSEE